jgi:GNAT superfamily N-acetyltransferase
MPHTSLVSEQAGEAILTTWKDVTFRVRPFQPDDEGLLAEFFTHVSPDDRRFRFLADVSEVGPAHLQSLITVDHERSENFLAFDKGMLIGSAMLAADAALERAEVAVSLRADYKNMGIGWALLDHLANYARRRNIRRIESVESRENRQALAVETDMGFKTKPFPGDPTLVLVSKDLTS